MSDASLKETEAFVNFFATFQLTNPVSSISDLSDGVALLEVLSLVDADYFRQSTRPSAQSSDNWVLRFGTLKRLYRLMTQYFSDVLQKPTTGLDVPNLQAIAKDYDSSATLALCRMTIAIGVQCEKNKEFIEKIQGLSETDQHHLMRAIEQVMSRISDTTSTDSFGEPSMTEDDHYYRIQSEKSQIMSEKDALEKAYQTLLEEHRQLQTAQEDLVSERDDALVQVRQVKRDLDSRRGDSKADVMLRAENDRLRADLLTHLENVSQKSEDNFAVAESELEKQTSLVSELTRENADLREQADLAHKYKDQLDEQRHATEKLSKMENVMDKYKKKLQEGSELRQTVKSLEKQNSDLVDKNASLEEEYRKVSAYKPLLESYKSQVAELENRHSTRTQEIEGLKFELEQTRTKLKITEEERAKDSETLELYQERVRELELAAPKVPNRTRSQTATSDTLREGESASAASTGDGDLEDEDDSTHRGLGGELDDAITGTTMTDLKIQISKLKRELESVRKNEADASKMLVMENLLDDANRMKQRYEADYLTAHREKLVLQRDLEEIRSGKSMGDGTASAIALRQRLNETVDQLEELRKNHAELQVKSETQERELTVAKSDLTLVNKDQIDILATLRESVNEDKAGLEGDIEKLRKQNKDLSDKTRMQLEQINALLLEKVNLQSEGISQREKSLQRERDFGELRAMLSGKDIPEDIKARMLALHEENVLLKETNRTANDKLVKAKQFIKEQDKLFREENRGAAASGMFDEAETSFRSQIKILEDENTRQKVLMKELQKRYHREQSMMIGLVHSAGMDIIRGNLSGQRSGPNKSAWLPGVRNTRPTIASAWQPFYSSSPSFSAHSTQSILSLQGQSPLPGHPKTLRDLTHATELLTLPSSFGSIQLGETFSSCLAVNNESATDVEAITLKVEMQTVTSKVTLAEVGGANSRLSSADTLERVVHHEIKELGQHVLACTVSYRMPSLQHTAVPEDGSDPSIVSFRKFYKFVVTNPLSVKTKVHTPRSPSALLLPEEREKVFLEVHIQNLAADPIWFESMRFEATEGWRVQDTNGGVEGEGLFLGSTALMQPQDMRQYIYILSPSKVVLELVSHAPGTIIPLGRLDLSWRSSYGEPGRLLTSMLSRRIPLPPQQAHAPASALPPHLKRGTAPGSTPIRPRSPQLSQSRPSSPTPLPNNPRPSSPLPLRNRAQSNVSARGQSPPPQVPPISLRSNTIETNLVVRNIPRESILVGEEFTVSFTLILSSLLPPERRGHYLRLALILQHTFAQRNTTTVHNPPAPPKLLPEASTPKAISPGFSTPSPVYSTFNYALAYQKLAASSSQTRVASNENVGDVIPHTNSDKPAALPPPHHDLEDPKRRRITEGVTFTGASAIALPYIDLKEDQDGDEPALNSRVYATHDFELSFIALCKGFQNVGGLRLLLSEEMYRAKEQDQEDLPESKAFTFTETQVLKDWDVIAELWVS
ncbi:hypothetical protein V5O48_003751 [Marasmius crinis-equi]|uniref:HOOK-domain-containing protein n=1 Tax=Marasmius crinis-equi TaxID=585013 RepID=A0ABR3FS19_9AGAR